MTVKDVPAVHRLLKEYLSQFNLVPVMSPEEVQHWLLPQENIIDTFVVEVLHSLNPTACIILVISNMNALIK